MKIESKWCWFNQIEEILRLSLGAGARAWTPTRTPDLNKIIVNDRARGQAEGKEKSEFIYFNLKPRHLFDWKLCADPKNTTGTSNASLVLMKLYTIWYLFMVFKGFSFGTCFACLSSSCSSRGNRIMGHTSASSYYDWSNAARQQMMTNEQVLRLASMCLILMGRDKFFPPCHRCQYVIQKVRGEFLLGRLGCAMKICLRRLLSWHVDEQDEKQNNIFRSFVFLDRCLLFKRRLFLGGRRRVIKNSRDMRKERKKLWHKRSSASSITPHRTAHF